MSEIPDVIAGEVIEVEWGNDIRDRVVQRYASAAARSASEPSPTEGDVSYLQDTNFVYVYNGSSWVKLTPAPVVTADITDANVTTAKIADANVTVGKLAADVAQNLFRAGGDQHSSGGALTGSFVDKAAVAFTKPASWATYRITAFGTGYVDVNVSGVVEVRAEIGASNGTTVTVSGGTITNATVPVFHTVDTSTSPVTVAFAARVTSGTGNYQFSNVHYVAFRLT